MNYKNYLATKNFLVEAEKKIRAELLEEKASPIEVEEAMPDLIRRVLENYNIDADEYFELDRLLDKEGGKKKKMLEEEIDIDSLREEDVVEKLKEQSKGWIKDILAKFKKK